MSRVGESLQTLIFACCNLSLVPCRLWAKLTQAIYDKNMDRATEAKTAVEESQRDLRRQREENSEQYIPRFFAQNKDGRWIPKFVYVIAVSSAFLSRGQ